MPRSVTATAGDGEANVSWAVPNTDPNFPLTGYVITPIVAGIPETPQTFGPGAAQDLVTGLTDGDTYTFTVTAVNAERRRTGQRADRRAHDRGAEPTRRGHGHTW